MATREEIQELQARFEAAHEVERRARDERIRIEIELARARGDEFDARWAQAILDGDTGAANACYAHRCAERVLGGSATLDDFEKVTRTAIAAEVERLRAEQASKLGEGADAPSTAAP